MQYSPLKLPHVDRPYLGRSNTRFSVSIPNALRPSGYKEPHNYQGFQIMYHPNAAAGGSRCVVSKISSAK